MSLGLVQSVSWGHWWRKRLVRRKVVITDISHYRIDLAKRMGVQHVVNAAEEDLSDVMTRLDMTEGFDVGLEMSALLRLCAT